MRFPIHHCTDKVVLVFSDPFLLRLERILRDACLKLNACNTYTEPLNEEATFGIQISTSELSFMEFNDTPSEEVNNNILR